MVALVKLDSMCDYKKELKKPFSNRHYRHQVNRGGSYNGLPSSAALLRPHRTATACCALAWVASL